MNDASSGKGFDPARYLRKLGKGDYLEVKWRLVWLRTEHPDAVIETELMQLNPDPPMAIFRAKVSIPGGGSATGWGQEEPKDFNDYLEKAETKAIGRALGALGYGTQFTDEFEFTGDTSKVVDAPVERPGNRPQPTSDQRHPLNLNNGGGRPEVRPVLPATAPQIKAIFAIHRAKGQAEEQVDEESRRRFGVPPSGLSRRQASEWLDATKAS